MFDIVRETSKSLHMKKKFNRVMEFLLFVKWSIQFSFIRIKEDKNIHKIENS